MKKYENLKVFDYDKLPQGDDYWYYKNTWKCFKEFLGLGIGLIISIPYLVLLLISDIYKKLRK